jgi:hypothetical protein
MGEAAERLPKFQSYFEQFLNSNGSRVLIRDKIS